MSTTTSHQPHSENLKGRKYTWDEIHKHKNYNDCWIVVKGKVYDVTSWVPSHPGGDLILQGGGREATALFQSYHRLAIEKMLPKYEIGEVENYNPYYTWDSDFYRVIKERVEAHFQKKGITGHDSPLMYFKTFWILTCWAILWYLTMVQGWTALAILLGVFQGELGISIGHDGNHGSYSKSKWISAIAGHGMDLMGGSHLTWVHQHNIGHHPNCNRKGGYSDDLGDPDTTSNYPITRMHPNNKWRPYHQYQHIYIWILISLSGLNWVFADLKCLMGRRYGEIEFHELKNKDYITMIASKIIFIIYGIIIPLYMIDDIYKSILTIFLFISSSGYMLMLNFAVNHLLLDNQFPDQSSSERDWAKLQVVTSSNFCTDSFFWGWMSGGLNFQIEHHLFPGICHIYLPEIAPIVQQACKEYGVNYTNKKTYIDAIGGFVTFLKYMGTNPDDIDKLKSLNKKSN